MARVCGDWKRGMDHFDLCAESATGVIIAVFRVQFDDVDEVGVPEMNEA